MNADNPVPDRVKTTDTAFDILETLRRMDGASITELGAELDIANSTVHRHLTTLRDREYVVEEDGTYYVGLKFLGLGDYARRRYEWFDYVQPKVAEIAEETGERAQFLVEEHGHGLYLCIDRGQNAVRTDPGIGRTVPLHVAAAGKAILAHMPERRVEEILDRRGLAQVTANTITDRESLLAKLRTVRERGYAYNDQEYIEGLWALGVPVKDPDGRAIGALSVSGPIHRMKGTWYEDELLDMLLGAANELELNIEYGTEAASR